MRTYVRNYYHYYNAHVKQYETCHNVHNLIECVCKYERPTLSCSLSIR